MAQITLPRSGAHNWTADTDIWPGRNGFNAEFGTFDQAFAIYGQGVTGNRPGAAYPGRFYFATDTRRLWYDTGTAWEEVSPVGGGGTPSVIDIGDTGSEGLSRIAARADHQHAFPAPALDPGASAYGGAADRGSSVTPARADHSHALPDLPRATGAPGAIAYGGSGSAGVSTLLARQDHTHTLPDLPRASTVAPGSLSFGGSGSLGTSSELARADHTHSTPSPALATGAPGSVVENTAGSAGVSTTLARADHSHSFTKLRYGGNFTGDGSPGIPSDETSRNIPFQNTASVQGGITLNGSGYVILAFTGVYQGFVKAAFEINLPQVGHRLLQLGVNGAGSSFGQYVQPVANGHSTAIFIPFRARYAAGTQLSVMCAQLSGAISRPDVELGFDLVSVG